MEIECEQNSNGQGDKRLLRGLRLYGDGDWFGFERYLAKLHMSDVNNPKHI